MIDLAYFSGGPANHVSKDGITPSTLPLRTHTSAHLVQNQDLFCLYFLSLTLLPFQCCVRAVLFSLKKLHMGY